MEKNIVIDSPIGPLYISASDDSISKISFHASSVVINKETNDVSTIPETSILSECKKQLDDYFKGERTNFTFPIKLNGTEFQQSVWNQLLLIPYGRTTSYMQLSKQIGNTKAIRAVGTANGKNNIAIVIPCHRVIGSNGTLVGYGGELWRKKWLLDHESKFANGLQKLF